LEQKSTLYEYQFGLRKNHSTAQAVIELLDNTGWSKKRHKVYSTITLQPYITVMRFSAKCSERSSLLFNSTLTVRRCDGECYHLFMIFAVFDVSVIACRR